MSGDYPNASPACAYHTQQTYNSGSVKVPFQGKVSSGVYIVPTWNAISYDALTAKVPNCSGYADIQNAYGQNAGACQTTYRTSLCGNPSR